MIGLIIQLITTTSKLTNELIRPGDSIPLLDDDKKPKGAEALPRLRDPKQSVRLARLEWHRAAVLAGAMFNNGFRSQYLATVAEGMSKDSAAIIDKYVRPSDRSVMQGEPAKTDPKDAKEFEEIADEFLTEAAEIAARIERPIWKNMALARTAIQASESEQYDRAFSIARSIENAEARAQALLLVAESQCRHQQAEQATRTYSEVAEAVARVDQGGLRKVLTGFLVDSLISTGRFEDARACLVLYPTEPDRFVALGAVAESQGRRGSPDAARAWIAHEVPEAYRSALYRRVNNGILISIQNNRNQTYRDREPLTVPGR